MFLNLTIVYPMKYPSYCETQIYIYFTRIYTYKKAQIGGPLNLWFVLLKLEMGANSFFSRYRLKEKKQMN